MSGPCVAGFIGNTPSPRPPPPQRRIRTGADHGSGPPSGIAWRRRRRRRRAGGRLDRQERHPRAGGPALRGGGVVVARAIAVDRARRTGRDRTPADHCLPRLGRTTLVPCALPRQAHAEGGRFGVTKALQCRSRSAHDWRVRGGHIREVPSRRVHGHAASTAISVALFGRFAGAPARVTHRGARRRRRRSSASWPSRPTPACSTTARSRAAQINVIESVLEVPCSSDWSARDRFSSPSTQPSRVSAPNGSAVTPFSGTTEPRSTPNCPVPGQIPFARTPKASEPVADDNRDSAATRVLYRRESGATERRRAPFGRRRVSASLRRTTLLCVVKVLLPVFRAGQ